MSNYDNSLIRNVGVALYWQVWKEDLARFNDGHPPASSRLAAAVTSAGPMSAIKQTDLLSFELLKSQARASRVSLTAPGSLFFLALGLAVASSNACKITATHKSRSLVSG